MTLPQLLYAYTCIPEVGPRSLRQIMDSFADLDEAWAAGEDQLTAIGIRPNVVRTINEKRSTINPSSAWQELVSNDVDVVTIADDGYPALLREIPAPPPLLTYRGTPPTGTCVAIVGTRRCTKYGLDVAKQLARDLSGSGITVVSGLAYGIDAAAHTGAVEASGKTVAVVGTGLAWDVMYPAEHRKLAEQVLELGGCIVSEHPLRMPALPGHFPRRNRIVSGLCAATVVVEAGEKSGALLTAHLGLEQNREVLAVPGPITSPSSAGTNRLLRRGAAPCTAVADVLEAIGLTAVIPYPNTAPKPARQLPAMSDLGRRLYDAVPREGCTVDHLAEQLGLPAAVLAVAVTELELAELIEHKGNLLAPIHF